MASTLFAGKPWMVRVLSSNNSSMGKALSSSQLASTSSYNALITQVNHTLSDLNHFGHQLQIIIKYHHNSNLDLVLWKLWSDPFVLKSERTFSSPWNRSDCDNRGGSGDRHSPRRLCNLASTHQRQEAQEGKVSWEKTTRSFCWKTPSGQFQDLSMISRACLVLSPNEWKNANSRQLAEKVERFARKEAELAEKGECVPVIYPDPSVPYEERCIMWYTSVMCHVIH